MNDWFPIEKFELTSKLIDLFCSFSEKFDKIMQFLLLTMQTIATLKLTLCMYKIAFNVKHTMDSINLTDLTSDGS
jgi:hypothetical protein